MGVVGAALRGFGRALSKKSGTIKSVKPAKNLTKRRTDQQELIKSIDHQYKKAGVKPGSGASKIKKDAAKRVSGIHDKYEKSVSDSHKANKKLLTKTVGGAAAGGAGVVGAHGVAKHKFPKYKKFMERNITIKDGKVKLVPYKNKKK